MSSRADEGLEAERRERSAVGHDGDHREELTGLFVNLAQVLQRVVAEYGLEVGQVSSTASIASPVTSG